MKSRGWTVGYQKKGDDISSFFHNTVDIFAISFFAIGNMLMSLSKLNKKCICCLWKQIYHIEYLLISNIIYLN